jgi:hypothetical protein
MRIFISHSSKDSTLAEKLVDLLRVSLNLQAEEIRCTSVEGHRLPSGAKTEEVLRKEVHESDVLIGLISQASLESLYVAFELGARWGADEHLIPLLAPGLEISVLDEPLGGRNAIECKAGDLHKLVSDVGDILDVSPERPEAYRRHLERVLNVRLKEKQREHNSQSDPSDSELTVPEYFGQWLYRFRGADLTEVDQALIAGYFVQQRSEEEDFITGEVTETLDEARINLSNTSRSIRQLVEDRKVYPTRKDGRYQRYSVSPEGVDYLKSLLQEPVQS